MKKLIVILLCVAMLQSCNDEGEAIRLAAVEEMEIIKSTFIAKKEEECIKAILAHAEMIADSIIATRAVDALRDSTYQPKLQAKPNYIPIDSSVFERDRKIRPNKN